MTDEPKTAEPKTDESEKDGDAELEGQLNQSLDDVLDLLAADVERLKVELEFYRLGNHPQKETLIRRYVAQIDARQDRMDEVKTMILARGDSLH